MIQVETATVNGRTEFLTCSFGWRDVMTLTTCMDEFLRFSELVGASRTLLSHPMEGRSGRGAMT